MKKTTLSLMILFLVSATAAHSFDVQNLEEGSTDHFKEEINHYTDRAPAFLESIIGDQTVNIRINTEEQEKEVGVKLDGTVVQEIRIGGYENATLEVETTEKQINEITTSEEPVKELNTKLKNGEIDYNSNGTFNSFRTMIAEQILSIASLL